MTFLFQMNVAEWFVLFLVCTVGVLFMLRNADGRYRALLDPGLRQNLRLSVTVLTLVLCVSLSISEVSQFMTLDETAFGRVLRSPTDRNVATNWSQGASHTALLFWIPITRILQTLTASAATIDAALKLFHWAIGILLVGSIVWNVLFLVGGPRRHDDWLGLFLFEFLVLLPIDNIAPKTLELRLYFSLR